MSNPSEAKLLQESSHESWQGAKRMMWPRSCNNESERMLRKEVITRKIRFEIVGRGRQDVLKHNGTRADVEEVEPQRIGHAAEDPERNLASTPVGSIPSAFTCTPSWRHHGSRQETARVLFLSVVSVRHFMSVQHQALTGAGFNHPQDCRYGLPGRVGALDPDVFSMIHIAVHVRGD